MSYTQRYMTNLPPVIVAGRTIKRYHLTFNHQPIPHHIQTSAYHHLPRLLPELPPGTTTATITVLHHDDTGPAHLNAYTWTGTHLIDCRTATTQILGGRLRFTTTTPNTDCAWELPAIVHERSAWARHMLNTDTPHLDDYLADTLHGVPTTA